MDGVQVIEFQMEYPKLDLKLFKTEPKKYKLGLNYLIFQELPKGYRPTRIYKATKKGTKVKYKLIKTIEEVREYQESINAMFKEIEEGIKVLINEKRDKENEDK